MMFNPNGLVFRKASLNSSGLSLDPNAKVELDTDSASTINSSLYRWYRNISDGGIITGADIGTICTGYEDTICEHTVDVNGNAWAAPWKRDGVPMRDVVPWWWQNVPNIKRVIYHVGCQVTMHIRFTHVGSRFEMVCAYFDRSTSTGDWSMSTGTQEHDDAQPAY